MEMTDQSGHSGAEADTPMSARESLDLIDRQGEEVRRSLGQGGSRIGLMWAVLWFVIFGSFHLAGHGWPGRVLPAGAAITIMIVCVTSGVVVSVVLGVRGGRGVRGPSQLSGALYGWSWSLSYFALAGVNVMIQQHLPPKIIPLLWSGSVMVLAGALSLAGGALFRSIPMYLVGVWFLLTGVGSVLAGYDYQALVMAFGGLVGFGAQPVWCLLAGRREVRA
jgi:hypothetical protein